jgi:imidazolonepropionase-like amidohydrolase
MGTDAPQQFSVPGFSLHREMKTMEEAGMSRYEVLKSGTWNVGAYFANEDTFGTVEPGARADLLLLEANPLDDLSNVSRRAAVMVRGRWLGEEAIQERLAEIASSYGNGTE